MGGLGVFKNKVISFSIVISCILFVVVLALEKTKMIFKFVPMFRGEVSVNNFVITTTNDGSPILVNEDNQNVGGQLRVFGTVRSRFNNIISDFYNDNSVVVEVGPQFGYNTISLAKGLKDGGKVYAFEANSRICSALRKTLVLNNIDDKVVIKDIAISDHKGICDIPDVLSIKELSDGTYSKARIFSAQCSTLDEEMVDENRPVDLVAVDIPDMEIPILRSCESIIERSPDIVLVFTFDNEPVNSGAETEFTKLKAKGLKFYITTEKGKYTRIESVDELLKEKDVILIITRRDLV